MIYFFDGAMGTQLQALGLPVQECPEIWNLTHPENIRQIHRSYLEAGAEILQTHTFGAHPCKLANYGLAEKAEEIIAAAVQNAKIASEGKVKIAGALGPVGKLVEPLGKMTFDDAFCGYQRAIRAMAENGADLILLETFIDLQEMRIALLAAKSVCDLPVFCQLTYESNGRTVTGTDPATAAIVLDALGASVIGANCSLGPEQLIEVIKTYRKHTEKPLSVQPNAGLPILENQQTVFPMTPSEMASWMPKLIQAGATYIGGCCGTTPAHIREMIQAAEGILPSSAPPLGNGLWLTSRNHFLGIGSSFPPRLIGERINPTGRKALAQSLRDGNLLTVKREALSQIDAGAELLDINLGVPGLDITSLMGTVISELSSLVDVPLVIDTTDPAALESALKAYPGRALINSVSAEPERINDFLPLAKKYGAAVLCLPLTPEGIPATPEERLRAAETIRKEALQIGLSDRDLALDPLVLPIASDASAVHITLETLRLYRRKLALPTIMGLSNSSFGLPSRSKINSIFLPLALSAGLDAPLANPCDPDLKNAWDASLALLGHDERALQWSRNSSSTENISTTFAQKHPSDPLGQIQKSIFHGEKEGILPLIEDALKAGIDPLKLAEDGLTEGMNQVGIEFGTGRVFLPQVLLSAETMKAGFDFLKAHFPQESTFRGRCILATVQGDIHDLGKNIVSALLENSGFDVIDLGKDVAPQTILKEVQEKKPDFVGLCALMTTTLPALDSTVALLKNGRYPGKIMAGGAVLTSEYTDQLGIVHAKDAMKALELAKQWT